MIWFRDFFSGWGYVATVEATTKLVDDEGNQTPGGERRGYFVLQEKAGGRWRRVHEIGDPGGSPFANSVKVKVKAWECGGPLPDNAEPGAPAPRKPKQKTADLVVFPGGKLS